MSFFAIIISALLSLCGHDRFRVREWSTTQLYKAHQAVGLNQTLNEAGESSDEVGGRARYILRISQPEQLPHPTEIY